jgi:hypothetical protein
MATAATTRIGMTVPQIIIMIAYGTVLWLAAAMLVRAIGPIDDAMVAIVYGLTIIGTVPFVLLARPLATLRRDQTAIAITVATATAGLLDGIAISQFRWLYGTHPTDAAAAILWGAGVALVLGLVMNGRD